ncbi:MAG TPA: hypothetical protein VFN10_03630 [Thermoanaerobaculia bacterium]|nr:hypothetical protein [Thermoanaerobaculia bacterium]
MRSRALLSVAVVAVCGLVAVAATTGRGAVAPRSHGDEISGTVSVVDAAARTFVLRDAQGKTTRVAWTDATKVLGGTLTAGEAAVVRYMVKNGRSVATSVKITSNHRR